MRTALLSAVKRTSTGQLRSELTLAGRSVLAWQVDLVRWLGCGRIICLCEAQSQALLALQQQVEREGGTFHAARGSLQLASLVHANDELIVLCDGLILDRGSLVDVLQLQSDRGATDADLAIEHFPLLISTLPAAHSAAQANPEDFELIDRERHWAGFAIMRASHVHQLTEFPPDGEVMSLLLRLALQAHVECKPIDTAGIDLERWHLALDATELARREQSLVAEQHGQLSKSGFGGSLAAQIVCKLAPRGLVQGSLVSAGGAVALSLIALTMAVWSLVVGNGSLGIWALFAASSAAMAGELCLAWQQLKTALWHSSSPGKMASYLRGAIDAICALTLVSAQGVEPTFAPPVALAFLAIALARLAGENTRSLPASLWRDRVFQMAGFGLAAIGGVLSEALALFTLGAVAQLMLRKRKN